MKVLERRETRGAAKQGIAAHNTGGFGCIVILLTLLASVGCSNKSMMPGDLGRIQTFSDQPRAGNVYLLRGFIGIWSYGIDGIGQEINESGVRANVYRCEQWREVTDAIVAKYKGQKDYEPLDRKSTRLNSSH